MIGVLIYDVADVTAFFGHVRGAEIDCVGLLGSPLRPADGLATVLFIRAGELKVAHSVLESLVDGTTFVFLGGSDVERAGPSATHPSLKADCWRVLEV